MPAGGYDAHDVTPAYCYPFGRFSVDFDNYVVCLSSDKLLAVTIDGDVEVAKRMEDASLELGR